MATAARARTRRRNPAPVSTSLARIGERIRAARAEAGMSQSQLGKPHFTRAYISAVELGKIQPSMKSLEFLCTRLGKPMSFFVGERDRGLDATIRSARDLVAGGHATEAIALLDSLLVAG